ncbi:DUF6958 family protein [Roseovarius sp. Pro17]|uniref:DUF6958 family protein n=1 Tax=Roseovarius sp. Pro17 TaxID=3108175 RepID=UPI002D77E1C7|nr:hypothetical protein [Roseovarius sp. Pro17]
MAESSGKIEIENVNCPGRVERVAKDKYEAMKTAYLAVIPQTKPGATTAELKERLLAKLPDALFPGGAKAGWWMKAVQLDLEAKGVVARENTKPLRFHKI